MRTTVIRHCVACIVIAVAVSVATVASPSDFYTSYLPAKVVAHLPVSGGVRQMFLQQEGKKQYLYVQQPSQEGFLVVDTTKASQPRIVNHVTKGTLTMVTSGLAISESPDSSANAGSSSTAGNSGNTGKGGRSVPQEIRVIDVSDPAHPQTTRTFNGVTSVLQDPARKLIYIVNEDGVWIMSHQRVLRRHACDSSDAMSPDPNCN